MTVAEASAYLKVGRATLYRWAREGRLQLHKLGTRTTRIRRSELDQMLERHDDSDAWPKLSEASFAADWDNDKDAVYDDWKTAYGIPAR
jgi:excisionase family DNA binding protein